MENFFCESPSRTRIREFNSGDKVETILDVCVKFENGDSIGGTLGGFSPLELSRMAADLLADKLNEMFCSGEST